MPALHANFEVTGWDEEPFDEGDGAAKLTEATVTKKYTGDVEGTSVTKWLMAYSPDETATFVGIERVKGAIGGHHGSLVLQHVGRFADGEAKATLTLVSGTDELVSVTGRGDMLANPQGAVTLNLDT